MTARTPPLSWTRIEGGVCRYGDAGRRVPVPCLLWSTTPLTIGHLDAPGDDADGPLTGVSQADAAAIAQRLGGRLPRSVEWEWMAACPSRRLHPWGDDPWRPARAQLAPSGQYYPSPVGRHPAGATPDGMLDVAGCVWEWTATLTMGDGAVIRGGSYASVPLYARCTFLNAAPIELASPGIGLRVVRAA
jgi:iron(II)-dependent oxidoreductase